jgi:hypothetical protein
MYKQTNGSPWYSFTSSVHYSTIQEITVIIVGYKGSSHTTKALNMTNCKLH